MNKDTILGSYHDDMMLVEEKDALKEMFPLLEGEEAEKARWPIGRIESIKRDRVRHNARIDSQEKARDFLDRQSKEVEKQEQERTRLDRLFKGIKDRTRLPDRYLRDTKKNKRKR